MEYNGYKIEHDGIYGYYNIKPVGKGSVNLALRGEYTNTAFAMQAIDAFLSSQPKKAPKKETVKDGEVK